MRFIERRDVSKISNEKFKSCADNNDSVTTSHNRSFQSYGYLIARIVFLNEHYRPADWGNVVLVVIRRQQREGEKKIAE